MRTDLYRLACLGLLALLCCCGSKESGQKVVLRTDTADISDVMVALPEGDGKDLVEMNCVPCHSLRYIEMQPELSRKSWEKIVSKMIKNYGAPVRDSIAAAAIVDYLVAIKGAK